LYPADPEARIRKQLSKIFSVGGIILGLLFVLKGLLLFGTYYSNFSWDKLFDYGNLNMPKSGRSSFGVILLPLLSIVIASLPVLVIAFGAYGVYLYGKFFTETNKKE
jgi:hypothetical protein